MGQRIGGVVVMGAWDMIRQEFHQVPAPKVPRFAVMGFGASLVAVTADKLLTVLAVTHLGALEGNPYLLALIPSYGIIGASLLVTLFALCTLALITFVLRILPITLNMLFASATFVIVAWDIGIVLYLCGVVP